MPAPAPPGPALRRVLREADALDRAVYAAVAATPTPTLDRGLALLSRSADHSVLWFSLSAALALTGPRGREAAGLGVTAIAVTSSIVNGVVKPAARRGRPEREDALAPARVVAMPRSTSFPSGHAASAVAYATAVASVLPATGLPLRLLAGAVAYSRVHTGVHFPGDVEVGGIIGASVAGTLAAVREARRSPRG